MRLLEALEDRAKDRLVGFKSGPDAFERRGYVNGITQMVNVIKGFPLPNKEKENASGFTKPRSDRTNKSERPERSEPESRSEHGFNEFKSSY